MTKLPPHDNDAHSRETITSSPNAPSIDPSTTSISNPSAFAMPTLALGPFTLAIPAGGGLSISGNTAVITYAGTHISISAQDTDLSHFTIHSLEPEVIEEKTVGAVLTAGGAHTDTKVSKKKRKKPEHPAPVGNNIDHNTSATSSTSHEEDGITFKEVPFVLVYGTFVTALLPGFILLIFFIMVRVMFPIMDVIVA
jgi:hypothetical protein